MLSAAEQSILSGNKEKVKLNPFYFEKPNCSGEALSLSKSIFPEKFVPIIFPEESHCSCEVLSMEESNINGLGYGILYENDIQDDYLTLNIEVIKPNFVFEDDALYLNGELLGEILDGEFVPSELLLEKPYELHEIVAAFMSGKGFE